MKRKFLIALQLAGLWIAFQASAPAQTPQVSRAATISAKEAQPGETISVTVVNAPRTARTATVWIGETKLENAPIADGTITLNVPSDVGLGTYPVRVAVAAEVFPAGTIDIVHAIGVKPALAKVDPAVLYRPGDRIDVTLTGTNFIAGNSAENAILFNGSAIKVVWDGCEPADRRNWKDADAAEAHGIAGREQIQLCNVAAPKQTDTLIAVRQGPQITETRRLQAYPWTKAQIILASAGVVGIALLMVMGLMTLKRSYRINKEEYGFFRALFLDPETDTYSLSKYQFYMWTGAALFSYAYFVICRMFIQHAGLPDVPSNLPAVIGVGAGTSIGATVITNVKGPKGGGEELPSLSDFVTSGGVAAPERVQMFLWTTFGVFAFAVAAVQADPATINGLPQVPEALMYLMGLSSAGYLGGKLARKAGPVINEIAITPSQPDDAASLPTGKVTVGLDQPMAAAQQVLTRLGGALATLAGPATLVASQAAKDAVAALKSALSAAQSFAKNGDVSGLLAATGQTADAADAAARQAAQEFDRLAAAAPPDRGANTSRDAAQIAQDAAAASQTLAAGISALLATAQSDQEQASAAGNARGEGRAIELRGRNLSSDATFEIADMELPFRMLKNAQGEHAPDIVAKEDDKSLANMGRAIRLTIVPSELEESDLARYQSWFGTKRGGLNLTIINPDGQKSVISFSLPPGAEQAKTTSAAPQPAAKAAGG